MAGLRRLDAFQKVRRDVQSKSALGGLITLVAISAAAILFVSEIFLYLRGVTRHSLHLAQSTHVPLTRPSHSISDMPGKIPLKFMITFPHLTCRQLDFALDDASHSSGTLEKVYGRQSLTLRTPTLSELRLAMETGATPAQTRNGCTILGDLKIPLVAGEFAITITRRTWAEATSTLLLGLLDDRQIPDSGLSQKLEFNVSHYIHYIRFGTPFPRAKDAPLEGRLHTIQNKMGGIALQQIHVKLIPTIYQRFLAASTTYQLSVVDHTVQPETLVAKGVPLLPGIAVSFDFTPLAVHHVESRENILVFLSSLVSIVGGVFVTVGLATGMLVHSAAAVAKKLD
ncbi:reticulum-Golgi intermediate compartment protein 3 [Seminavis robusta]|uniref:Reticulum-Golgi intermediate compartment protein 3 n=1 Tax=Seminavis robusta TaxID=568900 RepID=A0A9N8HZG1_9STRA|nr:reticulum-Golgi intermediate compartment protein 3 [Seminavis robusta]|eukprot:Sro2269_g321380.1 reticulum-Golgi intermediate compartment protein 3 (341) ;mRNA; f:12773-13795